MLLNMSKTRGILGGLLILCSFSLLFVLPQMPLHSNKIVQLPITLAAKSDFLLVFFGYPHCNTICPTTLQSLSEVYANYSTFQQAMLQVVLINLDSEGSQQHIQTYAKSFHPEFQGFNLSKADLEAAKASFGISAFKTAENDKQILHSTQIYLLEKYKNDWKIKTIYRDALRFKKTFTPEVSTRI